MRSKTFSKDDMLNPYTDPNLERRARTALSLIKRHGRHMEMVDERVIQYGLEHNLFTQEQLDDAQGKYNKFKELERKLEESKGGNEK